MQPLTSTRTCTHTHRCIHTHSCTQTHTRTHAQVRMHMRAHSSHTLDKAGHQSFIPLDLYHFVIERYKRFVRSFKLFNKLPRSPCLASLSPSRSPLASGTLILSSAMEADFPAPGNGHEHAVACLPGCLTNAKPHGNTWSHGYSPSIEGETEAQRVQSRVKGQSIWGCFCGKKTRKHEFSSS